MAVLHLMIGIQGSGKSTYSKKLSKQYNCIIASTDEVRKTIPNINEKMFFLQYLKCAQMN